MRVTTQRLIDQSGSLVATTNATGTAVTITALAGGVIDGGDTGTDITAAADIHHT